MIRERIKFGTDGWRGVISDDFTFANVRIVSQAISEWINRHESKRLRRQKIVAVGYDTRFLSKEYAQTVSSVLAANGIRVFLSQNPIPTPVLSFSVKRRRFIAGVMITASHNPFNFNGIKIKTYTGAAASGEVTRLVEKFLYKLPVKFLDFDTALKTSNVHIEDFSNPYIKFLKSYVNLKKISQGKFRVLVDVMHGSGNGFFAKILKSTPIEIVLARSEINPCFGGVRPEPVADNLKDSLHTMKKGKFDLGLVLDGDADRIAAIDSNGVFISPQKILGLFILHLVKNKKFSGGLVKTIVGTTLIDKIARKLNLKLYETPVGFKYISDLMVNENIMVGGEEAGGMGFRNYIPERDGILAGLLLLEMMSYERKPIKRIINDMEREFGRYYYLKDSITLKDNKQKNKALRRVNALKANSSLLGQRITDFKCDDGVKCICADESWLIIRVSGTEPLIRIYAEAKTIKRSQELLAFGRRLIS
jgi:alpha-D-glucose phosphate-specific phosphoglucomutase